MNTKAFSSVHLKASMLKNHTYVAIMRQSIAQAMACLGGNRIKGRFFKVRKTG
jgi:ATP-independent RNA helicase DbpA